MSETSPTLAVIADLHGNLPALEAVLADLERVRPDCVVVAGDFANRGPQGRAVLELTAPLKGIAERSHFGPDDTLTCERSASGWWSILQHEDLS